MVPRSPWRFRTIRRKKVYGEGAGKPHHSPPRASFPEAAVHNFRDRPHYVFGGCATMVYITQFSVTFLWCRGAKESLIAFVCPATSQKD